MVTRRLANQARVAVDCQACDDETQPPCRDCGGEGHIFVELCFLRVCRVCGCDDNNACPGGCSWVAPALCSSCAPKGGIIHAASLHAR